MSISASIVLTALLVAVSCSGDEPTASLAGGSTGAALTEIPPPGDCVRWVSPDGDDDAAGSRAAPWATLEHAAQAVPDDGCTVFVVDGEYAGTASFDRTFSAPTVFRAEHPYAARLVSDGSAIDVGTVAANVVIAGFEITQSGPAAEGVLVYVSGTDDGSQTPRDITLIDNVIHDAWGDDLLKVRSGARGVGVIGNVFSNPSDQGQGEQHIDVNSAADVTIAQNVFFNDFEASGRPDERVSQHFIVVKDSNGDADGRLGSLRVTIEANVFAHYEGDRASLIAIGNDGKPYHEAADVLVRNNLMIGDGPDEAYTAFSVHGATDVSFVNNTVTGDLPAGSYSLVIGSKGANPPNEDILLANSIWSDPTASMGPFSGGDAERTVGLALDANVYWNGGSEIERGDLIGPRDDDRAVLEDPGLAPPEAVELPWWDGTAFASGDRTIRGAFERLVATYAAIPPSSPAVGAADPAVAPPTDILGRPRDEAPDAGAFESSS